MAERIFRRFYSWAAGLFRGFCCRIFSPHFCGKAAQKNPFLWESCPEKSSRKFPGKILQNLHPKNPRHICAEGPGQQIATAQVPSTLVETTSEMAKPSPSKPSIPLLPVRPSPLYGNAYYCPFKLSSSFSWLLWFSEPSTPRRVQILRIRL